MNDISKTQKTASMVICMAVMFLFAFSVSIIGLVLPAVITEYEVSLSQAGAVTVAQNAGGIAALAVCGYLSDKVGKNKVVLGLLGMMTVALLLCRRTVTFEGFVIIAMILGLSASALNMCISAFFSDLFPDRQGFYVNLGGVMFGLGSVLGPLYAAGATSGGNEWRMLFWRIGIAGAAVLTMGLFFMGTIKKNVDKDTVQEIDRKDLKNLLKNHLLWYFALTGFFYMAHSSAFMAWIPTFLHISSRGERYSENSLMTVYWISILLGRMLCTLKADRLHYNRYMFAVNLFGGVFTVCCVWARGTGLLILFILIGITTGSVFQVCLAETCRCFSKISGTASSIVALSASVGGTISCCLAGILSERYGFTSTLILLGVLLLLVSGTVIITKKGCIEI